MKFQENTCQRRTFCVDVASPGLTDYKGMAEIRNIKLIDMVKLMFQHTTMHISSWGYALQIASYLSNLIVDRTPKMAPFKQQFRPKYDLDHLRVQDCQVIIHRINNLRVKGEEVFQLDTTLRRKGIRYTAQRQINWLF